MRIKAHPTTYKGVRFRSRLEARWAAFFDLAGWQWQYEPSDYAGWAPDFAIIGRKAVTLVEVKPIEWVGDATGILKQAKERPDLEKVRRTSGREILILGAYPLAHAGKAEFNAPFLGILWAESWHDDLPPDQIRMDCALLWSDLPRGLDFSACSGSFAYRLSGEYAGDHHLREIEPYVVADFWARAGNTVQWRAR